MLCFLLLMFMTIDDHFSRVCSLISLFSIWLQQTSHNTHFYFQRTFTSLTLGEIFLSLFSKFWPERESSSNSFSAFTLPFPPPTPRASSSTVPLIRFMVESENHRTQNERWREREKAAKVKDNFSSPKWNCFSLFLIHSLSAIVWNDKSSLPARSFD